MKYKIKENLLNVKQLIASGEYDVQGVVKEITAIYHGIKSIEYVFSIPHVLKDDIGHADTYRERVAMYKYKTLSTVQDIETAVLNDSINDKYAITLINVLLKTDCFMQTVHLMIANDRKNRNLNNKYEDKYITIRV